MKLLRWVDRLGLEKDLPPVRWHTHCRCGLKFEPVYSDYLNRYLSRWSGRCPRWRWWRFWLHDWHPDRAWTMEEIREQIAADSRSEGK